MFKLSESASEIIKESMERERKHSRENLYVRVSMGIG
ncbi:hypothetical protein MEZE111188_04860 [Mesobacillus zeae]